MYKLYFSKRDFVLKIEPIGGLMVKENQVTDEAIKFNDFFYVCNNRKILREKAKEIKERWIKETEENLSKFKNMEIKNKYK